MEWESGEYQGRVTVSDLETYRVKERAVGTPKPAFLTKMCNNKTSRKKFEIFTSLKKFLPFLNKNVPVSPGENVKFYRLFPDYTQATTPNKPKLISA
jgi:hypothetical protein